MNICLKDCLLSDNFFFSSKKICSEGVTCPCVTVAVHNTVFVNEYWIGTLKYERHIPFFNGQMGLLVAFFQSCLQPQK